MATQEQQQANLLHQTLDLAKQKGASAAEAAIASGAGLTVTVRQGELDKVEHEQDKSLDITVFMGQKKGNASTTDISNDAIEATVQAAIDIARYASDDAAAGLAAAELMATEFPDLDLYHPWNISAEDATALALECENTARESDARITNSDGCMISSYAGEHSYANSHGFIGYTPWSNHMFDCTVIAEDENGMQRDGWYSKARAADDLESPLTIGKEAARRTLGKLSSRKLTTRECPVIFEAPLAKGLFSALLTAISGSALYRQASFLQGAIDQRLFPNDINLSEQPYRPRAMGSAAFDNDGVATREKNIISNGVLQTYLLSAYSARKLGMEPTANAGGVHNLVVEPTGPGLEDLLKQMGSGLFITDMIGFGVNQVTGDYSRGASGFWVEDGVCQYPVEEITVAGNLKDMYQQVLAVGNDVDQRGNILTGSVLIENMTVAGE